MQTTRMDQKINLKETQLGPIRVENSYSLKEANAIHKETLSLPSLRSKSLPLTLTQYKLL